MVADHLAAHHEAIFVDKRYGWVTDFRIKNRHLFLLKPSTFMNLSGNAVRYWMQQEKIPLENLLVITDDLALPAGKLRLRGKGSAGGHNGLQHIEDILGTRDYARLRFGVGSDFSKGQQVRYVLEPFADEQLPVVEESIERAGKMVESFALQGLPRTMSQFNG